MTFSVIETLPDGRERVLAHGLSLAQVHAYVPSSPWAISFRQETAR